MRKNILLIILSYFFITIGLAQSKDSANNSALAISTFNMFREPSYILFGGGIGNMEPLIFEADVIPYYMLSLNRTVKWGIQLSPRIILRMYNKYSNPIRTPSLMPSVTFFYQLIDNSNEKRDLFTYFTYFHHSNGQDGSFYNADSTINKLSGSFSTNWIEGGVFLSRPDPIRPYNTNFFKLFMQYNYQQDIDLFGIYGRLRFFTDFQSTLNLSKVFEIFRWVDTRRNVILNQSFRLGWIAGNFSDAKWVDKKRLIFRYTLTFNPSFLNDVTLFGQYYYGQDYYNIHFKQTLNGVRIGIATKASIFN